MKIDDRQVPAVAIGVWKTVIERMAEPELMALGAPRPELQAGFRPGRMPASALRTRLKALLEVCPGMPDWLGEGLAQASLARSLVGVLPEEVLATAVDSLDERPGRAELAAALLIDPRDEIRALGFRLLEGVEALPEPAVPVSDRSVPQPAPGVGVEPARRHAERPTRDQLLALREERRRARQLARDLSEAQDGIAAARKRADDLAQRLRQTSAEAASLATELAGLREAFERRVDAAVAAQLDARLRPWLASAESLQHDANALAASEPLEAAEALLARQSEIDARYGQIARLRAAHERGAALLARLREAQAQALQPLPALAPMIARLTEHQRAIERRLGVEAVAGRASSPLLIRLGEGLATATTLDAIACVRNGLHETVAIGLLDDKEAAQAYALIHDTASRVYDRHRLAAGKAPSAESLRGVPLYALQAALARGQACALVVDGHNVLHALPTEFRSLFEAGVPGPRARRALEERLSTLIDRHPSLRIQLWFDGPTLEERAVSTRLRVRFSGGVGPDRADHAITAYLQHLQTAEREELRAVVTADAAVASAARAREALVLEPDELGVWTGRAGAAAG